MFFLIFLNGGFISVIVRFIIIRLEVDSRG